MSTEQLREHEWVFEQLTRYLDGELGDEETAGIAGVSRRPIIRAAC